MLDIGSVIGWFKKTFSKRDIAFIIFIIGAYCATRIIHLDQFPIFTDEGIYIRWAKVAWKDAAWRFISLTDGKQPLHTWGMIPFLKLFGPNLLLGGRMFSVLTGFTALVGILTTCLYLFNKKAAYIAALLYVFTPMFLFYDRMALIDSAVNSGAIWLLFFSILMVRTLRLDVALIFGLTSGIALLAKSSSTMFMGLSALAPIVIFGSMRKRLFSHLVTYYILYVIVLALAFTMYNVQRLSPYLHFVTQKNATFVMTFSEFVQSPFSLVKDNLWRIPYYVASEMSYVLFVLGLIGFVTLFKKNKRLALYLSLWIILPYISIAFFAKVIFPRYLIFFASLLTISAAYFVSRQKKALITFTIATYIFSVTYFNYTILFKNESIPFPPVDRGQYIESANSGYGIKNIIQIARAKALYKPVILIAEGNFGVVGDMLEASIAPGEKITVRGYWPLNEQDLFDNQKEIKNNNVLVVYSHKRNGDFLPHWPIKLIKEYVKPGGNASFHLFELVEKL